MKKEWSLYTVFDLLRGLNSWNFRRQKDLVLYFGYNLDNVPLEKLVEFAHAWLKHGLIKTDDINKIPEDIALYRKNRHGWSYIKRKNKLEKTLGVDLIKKEELKKRKEEAKKNKAEARKRKAALKKETIKKST